MVIHHTVIPPFAHVAVAEAEDVHFRLDDPIRLTYFNKGELRKVDDVAANNIIVREGAHIARHGDEQSGLIILNSGSFKSYAIDIKGRERVLGFFMPGEIMGFDAIRTGRHIANLVALGTSNVSVIPLQALDQMLTQYPGLRHRIINMMSERLSRSEALAGDFTAEELIAAFLNGSSRSFSERGYSPSRFNLTMSRRDIANYLRLAPETVSRILTRFADDRLIVADGHEMVILDAPRLADMGRCVGFI